MGSRFTRGLSVGDTLIALGVILVLGLIIVPLALRSRRQNAESLDVVHMRNLYVGWSLYQESHDGSPPSRADQFASAVNERDYRSDGDPFTRNRPPFPLEPSLPSWGASIPFRNSYAYAGHYYLANRAPTVRLALGDPRLGLFASPWNGLVEVAKEPFNASVDGPIVRVNGDGSAYRLAKRRSAGPLEDFDDLFLNR